MTTVEIVASHQSVATLLWSDWKAVFTRESSYCFQRVLAIAILSVRLSVCLSHGWISQKRYKLESPNLHCRLP